jgi:hypothetical protein
MATFRSSQEINRQLPTQYAQRKKATGMQVFANWATGLDRFGRKKDTNILGDVARGVVNMATLGGLQMATRKYYRGSAGGVGAIQAANQAQGKAYVDLALTAATLGTGALAGKLGTETVKQAGKQGIKSAIGNAVQQGKNLATSYLSTDGTKNLSKDFVQNLITKGGDTKFIEFAKGWALENKDELIKKGIDKGLEKAKEVYKEQFGNEPIMQPRGAQEVFAGSTDYDSYLNTPRINPEYVERARNMRQGTKQNEDGSVSTVRMALSEADGKYYAFPTLFQKEDGSWYEVEDPFAEAKKKGELFEFDTEDEASYFAEGGWKPKEMKTGGKIPNHYPSHKEGGVMAIDKKTGKPVAEVEGGEEVFSVKDTKKMESFMKKGDTKGLGKFVNAVMKKHRKNPNYSYAEEGASGLGKYSDFKEKIAKVESKGAGGYKAQNPESSAVGKYQFIWDGDKNWRGWKSDIMKVTGVKSKEEFLNSEKAQEQFMDYYIENTLKKDADSLRKTNPEETKGMSDEQLMALAHFQGRSNAKTFLETGKTANKENNLSVEEYLNKAGFTNEGGESDTNEGGQSDKKEDVSFLTTLNQSIKEAGKGFAEPINEKRKQVVEREESIKELEKKWKNSEGLDDETKDRIYNDLQNERLSKLLLQKEILDLKKERNDKINEVFDLEENKTKLFEEYDKGNITEEDYKKIRSELNQFSERNALFNQKYQELTDRYEAQKQARFPYDNAADYEAQNRLKEGTTKYLTAEEAARKDSAMAEEQGLPAFTEEEIQERIQEYKEEYGEQGVPAAGEAVGTRLPTGEEIEGGLAQMGDYTQRTELGVEGEASEYTKEKSRFVEGTKDDPFKKVKREMAVQGRTPEELEGEMQYLEQEFSSVNNVQDYDYLSTVLDEYALADEASFELDKEGKGDGTGQEEEYVPVDSESTLEDDYNLGNGNFDKETFDNYVRTKKEERQALGLENVYNKLGGLDAVLQATGMAAAYKFATAPMPQQRKSDAWQEQMARMKDRTQLGLDPATKTLYQRNAERTYAYDVSNIGRVASSANAALGSLGSASERKYQADMMMAAQDASLREAHQAQYMNAMEKDEAMTQEHWLRNVYNEADRKRELKAGLTGQFVSNLRDNLKYYEEYIDPSSMRNQYMQSIISETQAKEQSHLSSQYAQLRQTGMSEENAIARVYGEQQSQPESKVETGVFGGLINNIFNKK